ncbi:MAG: DapH/DapD/GlmU-related protein [Phycisphaerales bacterium]
MPDPSTTAPPLQATAAEAPATSVGPAGSATARAALSRKTPWTLKENIARVMWMTFGKVGWTLLPPARSTLIRLFGGKVGRACRFASRVEVTIPWNVRIGARVQVREGAIIYSLGPITIGDDSVLDARAHLCAGTHDMTDPTFPLVKPPITLGERCFVGIDAYIAPEVELGDGCRVWPRASVYKSFPDGACLKGNPARPIDPEQEVADERRLVGEERAAGLTPQGSAET